MIDSRTRRIYWPNYEINTIAYANLDGSGGGELPTGAATVIGPRGVAIDPAAGLIYWADYDANSISCAHLDGSGGADLDTGAATVNHPHGVAVDPAAGLVYWTNFDANSISFANLTAVGVATFPRPGRFLTAQTSRHCWRPQPAAAFRQSVAILRRARPSICGQGEWAPDLTASLLYRVPHSYSYRWTSDRFAIGETTSNSIIARAVAEYRCHVSAENAAGTESQTSRPYAVFRIGKAKLNIKRGTARLAVTVPDSGTLTLRGRSIVKQRTVWGGRASHGLVRKVGAGTVRLLIKAKGKARDRLERRGRARVGIKVAYLPRDGTAGGQARKVVLEERP